MKIKLYPKDLLETAWHQDKKLYTDGDAAPQALGRLCGVAVRVQLFVLTPGRF